SRLPPVRTRAQAESSSDIHTVPSRAIATSSGRLTPRPTMTAVERSIGVSGISVLHSLVISLQEVKGLQILGDGVWRAQSHGATQPPNAPRDAVSVCWCAVPGEPARVRADLAEHDVVAATAAPMRHRDRQLRRIALTVERRGETGLAQKKRMLVRDPEH